MTNSHGGRRANQTGRPPKADKKTRIGVVYLSPESLLYLQKQQRPDETASQTIDRLLSAAN